MIKTLYSLSASLRMFIYNSAWTSIMDALATGALLTAYATALGANATVIGCILAVPYIGNGCQMIGTYLIHKGFSAKKITVIFSFLSRFFYLGCASLVIFPNLPHRPLWLLFFIASCYILGGIAAGGYYPWLKALLSNQKTLSFIQYKYTFSKVAYLTGFVLAFFWFKRYTVLSVSVPSAAFIGLFLGAFISGMLASCSFLPITAVKINNSQKYFYTALVHIIKQPHFVKLIGLAVLCLFTSFYFFTFLPLFILKQWQFSVLHLTLLTLLFQAAAIGFVPCWKKINHKHVLLSARYSLWGCVLISGWLLFHLVPAPSLLIGAILFICAGILQIGINFAVDALFLLQAPENNKAPYFAIISFIKMVAASSIVLAGTGLNWLQGALGMKQSWQLFCIISIFNCLITLYFIYRNHVIFKHNNLIQ